MIRVSPFCGPKDLDYRFQRTNPRSPTCPQSNGFTLADPNDRGMLDVAGFDTTVPAVIADFVRS
jgi:hypothetical protein